MSGRRRKTQGPRQPRQRTKPDVIRTHLAIITSPSTGGGQVNLHGDVELVKAAVLYADSIEILSLGQQAVQNVHAFSGGPDANMLALMSALDEKTWQAVGGNPGQREQAVALLSMDPDALRAAASLSPEPAQLAEFADKLQESRDQMAQSMKEFRVIAEGIHVESGAAELDVAFRGGMVRYNNRVPISGDSKVIIEAFTAEVKRYLEDPLKCVLLDDLTASLVRSMIKEGLINVPERSRANAGEALLGTGFLSNLPAFPQAPMEQLLEVRGELEDPLRRYRRKVTDLRSHMLTDAFDKNADAEVHAIWRTEIDPAVSDIRKAMADHALSRELLREGGQDISQFVTGPILGGLAVIAANALDVNAALTAALGVGTASLPAVTRAFSARKKGRDAAKAHDLYYLYAVGKELQK